MAVPTAGAVDPWIIQPRERARFEEQFRKLNPVNGIVTGEQAKGFFLQSQLPPAILGQIWGLADTDADGKMNFSEFSIACKLITLKLHGFEIPKTLPASLLHQVMSPASAGGLAGNPLLHNVSAPIVSATPLVGLSSAPMTPPLIAPQAPIPHLPMGSVPPTAIGIARPMGPTLGMTSVAPTTVTTAPMGIPSVVPPVVPPGIPPVVPPGIPPSVPPSIPSATAMVMPTSVPSSVPVGIAQPLTNGSVVMGQSVAPPRPPPVSVAPVTAAPAVERVASLDSPLSMGSPLQEWAVPHQSKLKYTQLFNTTDRTRSGFLSGPQARNIMVQTQLAQPILAQIWTLADMDSDGRLSCEEFVLAMHLIDIAKAGEKIPPVLPADLIPPTFRRQRQGSVTSGAGSEPVEGKDAASSLPSVTFEDKRKENFEKGQAELERRRKALLEIQRKEQEERERKEKEEQEKREKIRLEQERRRQMELEKQLQRQREVEQEKEEQRRRQQEQREAARREMERQRQLEWEKQRCQELQQQRQREQEKVLQLKAKNQNLTIELSQLNEKVKELSQKISETRLGVSGVKTTIDGMRSTRDTQLQEMSALKTRLKEQNQRLVALSQEKARLEARNKLNMANDSATQEQVKLAFSNKQITLKQLRDRLADLQSEIEGKMADIENNNTQLGELRQQLSTLVTECEQIYSVYEQRRDKVLELRGGKIRDPTDYSASWGDSTWDAAPSEWPATTGDVPAAGNFMKYRALYEFVARNADELSFQPGDIIMVPREQNAEPGWLAGEVRGQTGWFPESYVELVDSPTSVMPVDNGLVDATAGFGTDLIADALQSKRQLEGIAEVPENVSDNGSMPEGADVPPQVNDLVSPVLGEGVAVTDVEAQALYLWRATKPTHLSFNKGDMIQVKEQQESWWYGEAAGLQGWFPKSYVKVVSAAKPVPDGAEYYMAMYPYQSIEEGDLSFQQGEVVLVTKKEGDWWTGIIGDRQGVFPSNYVQLVQADQTAEATESAQPVVEEPVVQAVSPSPVTSATPQGEQREGSTSGTPDFTSSAAAAAAQLDDLGEDSDSKRKTPEFFHSPKGKGKKPEIATVIAPYQATSAEQLDLQRGQLIMVRKKSSTGWWEGELQAKGRKRQIGWFPASYVKVLGSGSNRSTPISHLKTDEDQTPVDLPSLPILPQPQQQQQQPSPHPLEKVVALYSYAAQNEDELTFEKDDVITLLAKEEPSWWRGELNGVSGLFPSNYVALQLDSIEKTRQEYISELITTEEAYIEDMAIVHDVFEKPLLEGQVLTEKQVRKIFVNWREIIECNHMFLRTLRVRRDMSSGGEIRMIGDILCENLPRMTAYVRFCSCQLSAAAYLQQLTEQSAEFRDLARQCQADPRTKGMPLSSFLIKPMQRITKYPLIIKKILEYTPKGHPDWQNLQEALLKAEEFCKQVNEGVREKENSDRLEWLQRHVQCDGLQEQLIFNSLTNSLGPRKFLHHGILHKAKSGKELMGFLFNDFFLLAQPTKSLAGNHTFSFERTTNVNFKLYKKPLFLNEINIHTDDSQTRANSPNTNGVESPETQRLLRIQEMTTTTSHVLLAPTVSERNLWVKKLEEARQVFLEKECSYFQRQQSKQAQFGACGRVLVVVMEGVGLKPASSSVRQRPPKGMLRVRIVKAAELDTDKPKGKCDAFCEVSMGSQEHHTSVSSGTLNPRWNASMQFLVKDLKEDVLCVTVFSQGHFCPNEFLGRTEVRVADIMRETQNSHGPISKRLKLREVEAGEVVLKLDLRLFSKSP